MSISEMITALHDTLSEYGDIDISRIEDDLGNYIHITKRALILKGCKTWFGQGVLLVKRIDAQEGE